VFSISLTYVSVINTFLVIMKVSLLNRENTGLVIVDVQDKLMGVMGRKKEIIDNIVKLLHLSKIYDLPLILTEQYPKWLGPTLPELKDSLPVYEPLNKVHFNCCDVEAFNNRLDSTDLKDIILMGVESHICVFQTCFSLIERGYRVHVPQDAVDSRTEANWRVGLELMGEKGAVITSTEAVIYQVLKKAGTKEFKEMLKIIK